MFSLDMKIIDLFNFGSEKTQKIADKTSRKFKKELCMLSYRFKRQSKYLFLQQELTRRILKATFLFSFMKYNINFQV